MKLSVVVPAYNEEKLLGESLRVIGEAAAVFPSRELIVCDNNSTDRTAEIARAAGAKVVFEPVNQISRARNAGARAARGDWLLFVDADSYPSRELLLDVKRAIEGGEVLAGGATVAFRSRALDARLFLLLWNAMSRTLRWAAGAFVFVRADAFRAVGGFSEDLYASEELDLFRKLNRVARREGRRVAILHRHPLQTSERKLDLYSRGEFLRFLGKFVMTGGRSLRRREDCTPWYDGRR